MAENTDASTKAMRIETLAKEALDNPEKSGNAIDSLQVELHDLWKKPGAFKAVQDELDKIGDRTFSTLPNIVLETRNGHPTQLTFSPSLLDFNASKDKMLVFDKWGGKLFDADGEIKTDKDGGGLSVLEWLKTHAGH